MSSVVVIALLVASIIYCEDFYRHSFSTVMLCQSKNAHDKNALQRPYDSLMPWGERDAER